MALRTNSVKRVRIFFKIDWVSSLRQETEAFRNYVAIQRAHHAKVSFQDEYRDFLRRHNIPFDERYVWD